MKLHRTNTPPTLRQRDIQFLLYEWLDIEAMCKRERYAEHSRQTFDAVLDLAETLANERFAPFNAAGDQWEITADSDGHIATLPAAKQALDALVASGLMSGDFSSDVGGMQLPYTVSKAAFAWLQSANIGFSAYALLTILNAHLLAEYGTPEQVELWVRPMVEGRYFGTMCLSEPDFGSSLADIATRAVPQDDGTYRVTGTKMWISGGDQEISENIVHLVLAKAPGAAPGVSGISLFIVPKFLPDGTRNDVALAGLNHKMGNRATTNALLSFGDGSFQPGGQPGAIGYLVGAEGNGLPQMFHMMNQARVGVGLSATGIGYTGYLRALDYARGRVQGRPPGQRGGAQVPIIEHADVRRMLLAQKSYVEGGLALGLYCGRLLDEAETAEDESSHNDALLLLEVLTPIVKSWPSQWCLEANSLAIQIHGGYGYTPEYEVEQLYRDNRLNAIHEGTHGIHGLDLLSRKVTMLDGAGLRLLLDTISTTVERATTMGGEAEDWASQLAASAQRIAKITAFLWSTGDPLLTLANSTAYLEAVGHVVVAWLWLEQVAAADGKNGDFYDGKRAAARYFFAYELPKTTVQFDLLASLDRTALDVSEAWL